MTKQIFTVGMILCFIVDGYSQPPGNMRFRDFIFSRITVQKNLSYHTHTSTQIKKKYYLFDLYRPAGDSEVNRPLVIWMHGGGFKFGSKRSKSIRMWSRSFARRGYVCAAINYRLSKKNPLRNFKALVAGCSEAMEDVTTAMEYFRSNHSLYGIDMSRIILAGNSAGAIVALQTAYSDRTQLANLVKTSPPGTFKPSNHQPKISAVINFWGAIFDTAWLQNARVPIVSAHGRKDRVVPYYKNGSLMFGSYAIHQKANSLEIPNQLRTYDRYGHELQRHFLPILRSRATKKRWLSAGQLASDFIYKQFFQVTL